MTIRPLCAKRFAAAPLLSVISPLRPFVRPTDVDAWTGHTAAAHSTCSRSASSGL
jgi:hypothetical protein